MNNVKKAAALLLALALIFAFPVTASAAETTEAKVPVTLTVVNTVSPIAEARLVPAVVRLPTTMPTTAIPMARGQELTIHSTSARKPVLPVAIPAKNMPTTEIPTRMVSATIAAQPSA